MFSANVDDISGAMCDSVSFALAEVKKFHKLIVAFIHYLEDHQDHATTIKVKQVLVKVNKLQLFNQASHVSSDTGFLLNATIVS